MSSVANSFCAIAICEWGEKESREVFRGNRRRIWNDLNVVGTGFSRFGGAREKATRSHRWRNAGREKGGRSALPRAPFHISRSKGRK